MSLDKRLTDKKVYGIRFGGIVTLLVFLIVGCSSTPGVDPELEKRNRFDACVIEEKAKHVYHYSLSRQDNEINATNKANYACKDLLK
jgi:hypothetical protein